MLETKIPRVKICCISGIEEALMAIRFGASALGFVSQMPSGPGVINDEEIIEIVRMVPPPVFTFLLTCQTNAGSIIEQQRRMKTNAIQIVDEMNIDEYEELKEALPGISIVQVIHVCDENSFTQALKVSSHVDAILLDSGNPNLEVKELGGTGRVHNWTISARIREAIEIPVFLAGGLNPGNVRDAIDTVKPFGIDLCTGVRTNGTLDEKKLAKFFSEVKK